MAVFSLSLAEQNRTEQQKLINPVLSIVSPVYYAQDCIDELCQRIIEAVTPLVESFEIILVEDGSLDNSWNKILEQANKNSNICGIRLSRNFGQHQAITAGLAAARGEFVVIMDCDLQNPPEEIHRLYHAAAKGHEIVLSRRKLRSDPLISRYGSKLYHGLISLLSGRKRDAEIGSFCILSKKVVAEYLRFQEYHRTLLDVVYYLGFSPHIIDLPNHARTIGESSYSFSKKFYAAINELVNHSARLMYVAVGFSFSLAIISAASLLYILARGVFGGFGVPGWASLIAVVLFIGGFLGGMLGVVGLYIAKVYTEVRRRPLFVVQEKIN
jgi:polyisoprenyl-phosphate glycosyltransferase